MTDRPTSATDPESPSGTRPRVSCAVVTGASSGIGSVFARRLSAEGASLALVGRDSARLEGVAAAVSRAGSGVELAVGDLAEEAWLRALEQRLADLELDLLVNAAGLAHFGQFADLDRGELELHLRVDILALMRLTQAALPGMVSRGRGAIINVSSLMAFDDRPGWTPYVATKAFVTRFTENLAVELDGSGVTLQALCPGPVRGTEFFARVGLDSAALPDGVVMDPDDVVEASLAALARRELVCVPGLADPAAIEDHRLARLRVLTGGRRGTVATRYRTT